MPDTEKHAWLRLEPEVCANPTPIEKYHREFTINPKYVLDNEDRMMNSRSSLITIPDVIKQIFNQKSCEPLTSRHVEEMPGMRTN
jgi:hypothetical protein